MPNISRKPSAPMAEILDDWGETLLRAHKWEASYRHFNYYDRLRQAIADVNAANAVLLARVNLEDSR